LLPYGHSKQENTLQSETRCANQRHLIYVYNDAILIGCARPTCRVAMQILSVPAGVRMFTASLSATDGACFLLP